MQGKGMVRVLRAGVCVVLTWVGVAEVAAAAVDVQSHVRREEFSQMQLSPGGQYLAATLPRGDRTGLVILRLSDLKPTAQFSLGRNTDIAWFSWANDRRVLLGVAEKIGMLAQPLFTGEVVAVDAEGGRGEMLVGQRVDDGGVGTRIKPKKAEAVWARLADDLPGDPNSVILNVAPFTDDPYTRAERMDVRSGRRVVVARVPVRNADFLADHDGVVRVAFGTDTRNMSQLYHRPTAESEWQLLNDEQSSRRREYPLGFSADGRILYLRSDMQSGPDAVLALELASGQRTQVLRDDDVDPMEVIYAGTGPREPIGVRFMDGLPRTEFFRADHPDVRLHRLLEQAFEGESPAVVSRTADGRLALVEVHSDRNSGDFFLFDTGTMQARHLVSRRSWLDPLKMSSRRPVSFAARDGLTVHGYLTLPKGGGERGQPLVLLPHGGPYGVQDTWFFDEEAQLLSAAGYAVLQVNFRGSAGYGHAFQAAGARQWGLAMQDDLADATRWAIGEGIADPRRICIYGASYGAYAALMGAAREPELYRCAAGYVGLYDLPMRLRALSDGARSLETWSHDWMGTDPAVLAASSPTRLAGQIKVPVFMAAGGQDERTPPEHTRQMERALKGAGVEVEALYYPTEGHGFFLPDNRRQYYTRLLTFLGRHLGGQDAQ